ncbi:PREDICTED: LOW QUALITY PROTEIN: putative uncharacterized protein FLJ46235 [Mandrillus leucophaeus]|uniref:LOW QUALITY PROTEIN: putative uncharacterized protein FLJ46235 n=1 Tax=Mandrillus leucophaeus TaxID=9568 RepID=UPI0005F58198|nr:PREDICTED: LOW QUALITY PROTEIN: putative uncharacterized protein FLJ46235 [Mandrillus leucophaeus]
MACFGPTHASHGPPRSVSSCLTLAPLGRGRPSCQPIGAHLMPLMASPGPAPACGQPLQGQPLPRSGPSPGPPLDSLWPLGPSALCRPPHRPEGLSRPSSGLLVASPGTTWDLKWAPPGSAPASHRPIEAHSQPPSWQPLQAQPFPFLMAAWTGPTAASQQAISVGSAPAQLPPAFAHLLPLGALHRPSSGCSQRFSRVQVSACVPLSSPDTPSSSHTVACFSPTHASCGLPRGVSSCLTLASVGKILPHTSPVGPSSCLSWPLQAQPL